MNEKPRKSAPISSKEKQQKIATIHKIVELRTKTDEAIKEAKEAKMEVKRLAQRVEEVRLEGFDERRKLENKIKRSLWEVMQLALGNRKKVEEMSHRIEDTSEKLDKIQDIITWVFRGMIGLFAVTLVTALLKLIINF